MDYFTGITGHPVFRAAVDALNAGRGETVAVGGLPAGAAAFFLAALRREVDGAALVVAPTPELAEMLAADAAAFAGGEVLVLEPSAVVPLKPVSPGLETSAARLRTLLALETPATWCVAAAAAVQRRLPPPAELRGAVRTFRPGDVVDVAVIEDLLATLGYERVGMVEGPAQFARRGAIVDVFPPGGDAAYRLELLGDVVESIRAFDVWSQRRRDGAATLTVYPTREVILTPARVARATAAVRERYGEDAAADAYEALDVHRYVEGVENLLPFLYEETATVAAYFGVPPLLVVFDPPAVAAVMEAAAALAPSFPYPRADEVLASLDEIVAAVKGRGGNVLTLAPATADARLAFAARGVDHIAGRLPLFVDEARAFRGGGEVVVAAERPELGERLREMVSAQAGDVPFRLDPRSVRGGFIWKEIGLAVFPAWRVMARRPPAVRRRRAPRFAPGDDAVKISSPFDLEPGDLVVHADHGVARFEGLATLRVEEHDEEFITLTYAGGDRLYVPVANLRLVHKYVGGDPAARPLDRLGGADWTRARRKARKSAEKLAKQLVEIYAARAAREGHAFAGDPAWEDELAETFPFVETPDQLQAIDDVAADMAAPKPMDRLICGDVGFGKTEVAVRAALKAVADGMQVAVLVPTTILADQHFATFRERLAPFPARLEVLSRFRSAKELKAVAADLAAGKVDVVVGTHRLLSRDVSFANLGLLIVDEEQRFGVAQKEKIKEMRKLVDVLTLAATPIPRTLHMALAGLRDMSLIGTAPLERLPIHTAVAPFDEDLIADAITRELDRGGQVFFVHNRVKTIDAVASYLGDLVPQARFGVAHGQLPEHELERVMHDFAARRFNVLVSSAIIEAGLDFPNVNTIIINRADAFGLSQLHQLRGRVGRSHVRAYAYLLTPPSHALTDAARERLQALRDASELGSGFRLAMRDLEIRGAGNILGPEQSGAVAAVGLELYTDILARAVGELKGEGPPLSAEVTVRLDRDAFIPPGYIEDERQRLGVYRRLSEVADERALASMTEELRDRFGPLPAAVSRLLAVRDIRLQGEKAGVELVTIRGRTVTLELGEADLARMADIAAPASVAGVAVRPRRGKTVVTLTLAADAPAETATLEFVRRLAAGR